MRRLPLLLFLLPVVLLVVAGILLVPGHDSPPTVLAGTVLRDRAAPAIRLRDQFGQVVSLRGLRGRPVVLTFLDAACTQLCPIEAEKIRQTLHRLGPAADRVAVLAISTAPESDTPAAVRTFSEQHGLFHRWHFLTGARASLTPVWRSYYVFAAPANAPPAVRDSHTSATYVIDAQGHERVLFTSNLTAQALERDLRILLDLPVAPTGSAAQAEPRQGYRAPALTLPRLDGGRLSLSELRGKVVLLNFWATWCTACRAEMPVLQQWYSAWKGRGFLVVGVDQQEGTHEVAAYVREVGVRYPILLDQAGTVSGRYDLIGLPATFLIDRSGQIQAVRLGEVGRTDLRRKVESLLGASPAH